MWDTKNPRFMPFWIEELNPHINVPLQHDSNTRLRKHPQMIEKGRGRKKEIINIDVSLFMKIEEGHNLKSVSYNVCFPANQTLIVHIFAG